MTKTFHIVGSKDRECPPEYDGTVLSRDKKVMGYVKMFESPSGGKTFKATLDGYCIISEEELK